MARRVQCLSLSLHSSYVGTYIARRKDPAAPIYTERTLLAVLKLTGSLRCSDPFDRLQQAISDCLSLRIDIYGLRVLAFTAAMKSKTRDLHVTDDCLQLPIYNSIYRLIFHVAMLMLSFQPLSMMN